MDTVSLFSTPLLDIMVLNLFFVIVLGLNFARHDR